jgi:hypothetical protein
MHRFHRQELQRAEPLCAGGALYFLQQSLPCAPESRRVALAWRAMRESGIFAWIFGLSQSFGAASGAEVSRG